LTDAVSNCGEPSTQIFMPYSENRLLGKWRAFVDGPRFTKDLLAAASLALKLALMRTAVVFESFARSGTQVGMIVPGSCSVVLPAAAIALA